LFIINKVILSGRTTKEPELKYLPSGTAVCDFTLAVRRDFKNKAGEYESDFFNCSAFGKTGELIAEYVKKGALFPVCGRIHIRTYNDNDGVKHWITEIIVESFDFPPKNENSHYAPADNEHPLVTNQTHEVNLDDDIPF
jgi:single-strand DNA-binding protein